MPLPMGATTYVFRYLLGDAAKAPPLPDLLRLARAAGLERLQICENARPLELGRSAWTEVRRHAGDLGLEISLGCLTLDPAVLRQYLDRTEALGASDLRLILESETGTPLSADAIRTFLDGVVPVLASRHVRLAIESTGDRENDIAADARWLEKSMANLRNLTSGLCRSTPTPAPHRSG